MNGVPSCKLLLRPSALIFCFTLPRCQRASAPRQQETKQTAQKNKLTPGSSSVPVQPQAVVHAGSIPKIEDEKLIHYVRPVYPPWARKKHLEGVIEFRAIVGKDGKIRELTFVRGPKALVPDSESAVRQWRYKPITINGKPVEVVSSVLVQFIVSQ